MKEELSNFCEHDNRPSKCHICTPQSPTDTPANANEISSRLAETSLNNWEGWMTELVKESEWEEITIDGKMCWKPEKFKELVLKFIQAAEKRGREEALEEVEKHLQKYGVDVPYIGAVVINRAMLIKLIETNIKI